ncbi:DUF6380 family protein [Streptomyces sp. NPDC048664]|uniref:DUF6380 family protein n=1 Tax=Streptomyces sp. NPDC048664 TaxID=3154505 RepID=UPI00343C189B
MDRPHHGRPAAGADPAAEQRQATFRCGAASLTATIRRASFKHHDDGPAGEAAR